MEIIGYIIEYSTDFIESFGVFMGFLLVFFECFIPALPLSVFVALNVNAFGFTIGCLISWLATCLGSYLCYKIFSFIESQLTDKFLNRKLIKKIKKSIDKFKMVRYTELVLLITMPFTPSFLVNILAGLTRISDKKFVSALVIGKFFSIIFWGYIGKSLIKSLTDIDSIIYIVVALALAYIISKLVSRKMNID